MKRCTFLRGSIASLTALAITPAYAEIKNDLRCGTELNQIFVNLQEKGQGITKPGSEGKPIVVIAIDTQCPWCEKLLKAFEPLLDQIQVIWYPVAVLNDDSVTQAAEILSASSRWDKLLEHSSQFKAEGHRGLITEGKVFDKAVRKQVWENSKIFRRAGGTVVPLGAYKTPDGKYIAVRSGATTEELRQLLGLK